MSITSNIRSPKMRMFFFYPVVLVLSLLKTGMAQSQKYELSFEILNEATGTPLNNAEITIEPCSCGGATDNNGLFSINLPKNTYQVRVTYLGFYENVKTLTLDQPFFLKMKLSQKEEKLSEVIVEAKRINANLDLPQMGVLQLKTEELKKLPSALGEYDVLRGITLLAGVNNAGDVSNGLSVRGGTLDQNLVLFEYAPIFNPTHLFGLFSVFTPDVLSSVDLYRANIPSRYGGRTTSVLDIKAKNPYTDKFKLTGGIGLVSSRLNIETPIIKDKLTLISGVRAGFTDFLLPLFSRRLKDTKAEFYDGTLKLLYLLSEKDQVSFTGFYSKDFYQLDLVTRIENINSENNQYDFQTLNGTVNWLHSFNDQTNLRTVLVGSKYNAKTIFPELDSSNKIEFETKIDYYSFISEISKNVTNSFDYYLGVQANQYTIYPGQLDAGTANNILPVTLPTETSYELSAYTNFNWKPFDFLSLSGGLRYTYYLFQGPYTLNTFNQTGGELLDTKFFEKGEKVNTYTGLEPRLGAVIDLGESASVKVSYSRLNQYLQNIYNTTTPLPTSRWKTADPNIKPQRSDSYGVGIYKNLNGNELEVGLEAYYREAKNNLTYKPGADFFLEESVEKAVVQGLGRAYGIEFSFKKSKGSVNGWLNYTWSRSLLRTENVNLGDRINNNNWYSSDFDRPHVFNGTVNFEKSKYTKASFNFTVQTGRPFTVANGFVVVDDINVPIFLERNTGRLPTYHRLDFSWQIAYSKKVNKRWLGDWTFTVYNIYGRKNPINTFFTQRTGAESDKVFLDSPLGSFELSVLNSPLFSLTYNFKFQ